MTNNKYEDELHQRILTYNNYIDTVTHKYQKIYEFKIGVGEHSTWNNEADAFKHTFAAADMVVRHGELASYIGGTYHESLTINNPAGEKNMDYWNNSTGKAIANELEKRYGDRLQQMSKEQIANLIAPKVMEKMHKGELITSPSDQRKYTGFDEKIGNFVSNIRDKHNITGFATDVDSSSSGENSPKYMDKNGNRVYTREDLHNMSKEEENANHDAIMKQASRGMNVA